MRVNDTRKSKRSLAIMALVCFAVQVSLANYIILGAGHPNILLAFVGIIALTQGGTTAVVTGFVAGVIFDLATTGAFGIGALLMSLMGFVLGMRAQNLLADDRGQATLIFAIADVIVCILYHLAAAALGYETSVLEAIFMRALPTGLLTFLVFLLMSFFYGRSQSARMHQTMSPGPRLTKRS